jgi:hypothetical protein
MSTHNILAVLAFTFIATVFCAHAAVTEYCPS